MTKIAAVVIIIVTIIIIIQNTLGIKARIYLKYVIQIKEIMSPFSQTDWSSVVLVIILCQMQFAVTPQQ